MIEIKIPTIQEEPFEQVKKELLEVSQKLYDLLPDPSLSPNERIERLARVVPNSILNSENHLNGRAKLNSIRYRLAELVPDTHLSASEKIDALVEKIHEEVPMDTDRLYLKLEAMGDNRRSDIGR